MKYIRSIINCILIMLLLIAVTGCQQKMREYGRIIPLEKDSFFFDGSSARMPVQGTVSRDNVSSNTPFFTGRAAGGGYAAQIPVTVNDALLNAGQEQYGVYCGICHGAQGEGNGMVVQRGFTKPLSFLEPPLLQAAPGYLFSVMTTGFKTMDAYADLVDETGRWAIAAYIKDRLQTQPQ
jgi:mono/diheme cytochrome c family protein